jgi:hypothetical protein
MHTRRNATVRSMAWVPTNRARQQRAAPYTASGIFPFADEDIVRALLAPLAVALASAGQRATADARRHHGFAGAAALATISGIIFALEMY